MKKTASQIADQVLEKVGATFYRGMGEPFVEEVLSKGLEPGHSITTSLDVAREYGGKGAHNLLEGDIHKGAFPRNTQRHIKTMNRLGFTPRYSRLRAPLNLPPTGAVIGIDIPDRMIEQYAGKLGLPGLGERVVTQTILPENIAVLERGISSPGRGTMFPASMRRLTKKQLRLLETIRRRGLDKGIAELIMKRREPFALNVSQKMFETRTARRELTGLLKRILARGRI